MSNNFRRGQRVVCIVDKNAWWWTHDDGPFTPDQLPNKGQVYTINDIYEIVGSPFIMLDTLSSRWFLASNFRPVTDISIFHEILRKVNAPKQREELNV